MSKFNDSFDMDGILEIYLIPAGTEKRILFYRGKNLIMNNARAHTLSMATESLHSVNPITGFELGSGTTPPTGIETHLTTAIDPANYPSATFTPSVDYSSMVTTYTISLATTDANGYNLSEIGLFADNYWLEDSARGKMFNMKVFPTIAKTSSYSVVFVWKINFSGTSV